MTPRLHMQGGDATETPPLLVPCLPGRRPYHGRAGATFYRAADSETRQRV